VALELILLAEKMVRAGAAAILLEGVARHVAGIITQRLDVPVISCGAGADCDGQILIISDILGLNFGPIPKFSKNYADLSPAVTDAVRTYAAQIRDGIFPDDDHSYHMKPGHLEKLQQMLKTLTGE
ncbi:MAG: 3-methyl-2-oxobutanoate hydroxymethyltransferase, partial [Planctomycetota bacterium]